ncbi:ATP-binding protein [Pseudoalteromonas xiamenensis]|uniref:sensor histidine kinase n=1 Tax=Pseudoalteromonas xiamenensis TaxID=882626 RepID=UPI0027E4CC01|nr:ATP-binding protein [Pseudoalteromonas xiamenensis]WMN59627.1 ATP-binding protein [Pseudoalteromonas xiamenensis]
MSRLALSLLLVLFFSIFVINHVSEYVWQQVQPATDIQILAKQMATEIKNLVSNQTQTSTNTVPLAHFAWLPEQLDALKNGELVTLYSSENVLNFYFLASEDQVYEMGPYRLPVADWRIKVAISVLSYFSLIACLLLWLRPLWRDLTQLKRITFQLSQGKVELNYVPIHFSAIASLTGEIKKLTEKVASLLESQRYLVNAVSHELRTPLARLKFALAMRSSGEPKHNHEINQNISEMERLIDEMLSYARLEEATVQAPSTRLDLRDCVARACEKVTEVKVQLAIQHYLSATVIGDEAQLDRLFSNLLSNAVKYGHGQIKVSLVECQNEYIVSVEDNGNGIDVQQRDSAFEPFKQFTSDNRTSNGFGLGLAIVKRIATWHRASCHIGCSELGGAKISIVFPSLDN